MLGQGALQGRLDLGWLLAWALLLVTLVPFRLLATWSQGRLAIGAGGLLKQRLLYGALRLEQEGCERWHDGEDQALARYLGRSAAMDRTAAWLLAVVPRGWLCLGLLGLAPAFVGGHGSPAALAVGLGGMLLAYRAFHKLAAGAWHSG